MTKQEIEQWAYRAYVAGCPKEKLQAKMDEKGVEFPSDYWTKLEREVDPAAVRAAERKAQEPTARQIAGWSEEYKQWKGITGPGAQLKALAARTA